MARHVTVLHRDYPVDPSFAGLKQALLSEDGSANARLKVVNITSLGPGHWRVDVRAEDLEKTRISEGALVSFSGLGDGSGLGRVTGVHHSPHPRLLVHSEADLLSLGCKLVSIHSKDFLKPLKQWLEHRDSAPVEPESKIQPEVPPFNYPISLRARQLEAVENPAGKPSPFFLWGPPGTGKTYTLGALAYSYFKRDYRVLVVAPTNIAVDQAALAIDDAFTAAGQPLTSGTLVRAGCVQSEELCQREHLLAWQGSLKESNQTIQRLKRQKSILQGRLDKQQRAKDQEPIEAELGTLSTRLCQAECDLSNQLWELAEAAQILAITIHSSYSRDELRAFCHCEKLVLICDEAAMVARFALVGLYALLAGQDSPIGQLEPPPKELAVHFAGDPMQLAPIAFLPNPLDVNARYWRSDSQMSLLLEHPEKATRLVEQSRMSPAICTLISDTYYQGELKVLSDPSRLSLPLVPNWPDQALMLVNPRTSTYFYSASLGTDVGFASESKFDERSVAVGALLVAQALAENPDIKILWLSPFHQQSLKIRTMARFHFPDANLTTGTVHSCQGMEADLVIFDPVNPSSQWLQSVFGQEIDIRRMLNVVVSRAKSQVLVLTRRNDIRDNRLFWEIFGKLAEYELCCGCPKGKHCSQDCRLQARLILNPS
jgi:DNA polymerase alpha-associated DNA helicase A